MKTYLNSAIALSMLVFLTASCGKDKKKSKNNCDLNNPYTMYSCMGNGITGWNPLQPGQIGNTAAKTYLDQWMAAADTVPMPGAMGLIDFNYGNIQFFASSDYCYRVVGGGYEVGDYHKVDGPNYCDNMKPYSKSSNAKLIAAMNGDGGTLRLVDVQVQGTEYILYYAPNVSGVNYQAPIKAYKINMALHSMVNPVQVIEYGQVKESFVNAQMKTDLNFY